MPIRLSLDDVCGLPTAGRMLFVTDGSPAPSIDGARVVSADLFGNGLSHVFGNYLSAFHIRGGLAALCDDKTFLLAVRALADEIYGDGARIVDASPLNGTMPQVIEAIYPDAVIDGRAVDLKVAEHHASSAPRAPRATLPAPPVFVVGCPRSGTTWLQHLLCSHPALAGPDKETAAFVSVQALLRNEALGPGVVDAVRHFLDGLFAHNLALTDGATRFIEKTPIHARHLDTIELLFPRASIIGIHRDGRDVVRSLLQVDAGASTAAEAAEWWVTMTELVEEYAATHPLARDEEYEQLLVDPVVGAVNLLQWLGETPGPAVIDAIRARAGTRVSQYNTTGDVGSGKWREMSAADLRTVNRIAGKRLAAMGYTSTERVSVRERFRRLTQRR